MKSNFLCFILLSAFYCSCNKARSIKVAVSDTLRAPTLHLPTELSKDLLHKYYSRFGIIIPKYYVVTDSLAIELNGDSKLDMLAFLSPILLVENKYFAELPANNPKRVLVEIVNSEKGRKIRNVYYNLTSNIGGVLSKYGGLYPTKKGFEIRNMSGARYSWVYVTEFSTEYPDSLFLTRIQRTCSFNGLDDKKEFLYKKSSVRKMNVNDTISINCNCDKSWEYLEKLNDK